MPFKDPEKRRAWRKKWYAQHTESIKKDVRNRKRLIRKQIDEYKRGLQCAVCSENHPATLDFHHKSDKKYEINYLVANGYSIKIIEEELKKCEVLCSNCHRKLHYSNKRL